MDLPQERRQFFPWAVEQLLAFRRGPRRGVVKDTGLRVLGEGAVHRQRPPDQQILRRGVVGLVDAGPVGGVFVDEFRMSSMNGPAR